MQFGRAPRGASPVSHFPSSLQSGSSAEPRVRARADRRPRRGLRQRSVCGGEPSPRDGSRGRDPERERALSAGAESRGEIFFETNHRTRRVAVVLSRRAACCPVENRREGSVESLRLPPVRAPTEPVSSRTEEADGAFRSLFTHVCAHSAGSARIVRSSFERVSVCSLGYAMRLSVNVPSFRLRVVTELILSVADCCVSSDRGTR